MKILKEEYNPLLERKQVEIDLEHFGKKTPTNQEVKKLISEHFKTAEDFIVVNHIYSKFGEGNSRVFAYLYENKEIFNAIEVFRKKKKKKEEIKTEAKQEAK